MAIRQAALSMRRILFIFKLGIIIGLIVVFAWSISALEYGDYLRISAPLNTLEGYEGIIGMAAMSNDGNIVLFEAVMSDPKLIYAFSYFLFNQQTETLTPIDIETGSYEQLPFELSTTGRYLLYTVGKNTHQVWLRDLQSDTDERVSVNTTGGEPNHSSIAIGISTDGRYAIFSSLATNLVNDMTGCNQLFVRDTLNNTTVCVPVAAEQGFPYAYDLYNRSAMLSGDGSKLYYIASVDQCCLNYELFVYDLATQTTTPLDVTVDDNPVGHTFILDTVSYDGSLLTFTASQANNVVPDVSGGQVFYIYDSATSSVTAWDAFEQGLIAPPDDPFASYYVTSVAISNSERYVWGRLMTHNPYPNLQLSGSPSPSSRIDMAKPADEDGLYLYVNFVYDRETNTTTQILVNENTTDLGNPTGIVDVSPDGEVVLLGSDEATLVPDDTNGMFDLFLAFLQDETPEPTVTELLVNGNFEDNDNADVLLPDGWKKVGLLTQDRVKSDTDTTTFAHSAPNAFQIQGTKGEVGKVSKLTRNAKISGVSFTAGDTLTFSAMVDQRTGVPGTPIAKALVKYNNGSQQAMTLKLPNPKVVGYGEITVSKTLNRGDVQSIKVELYYGKATGKFYIDDVSLTHTPAESAPLLAPLTLPSAPEN